MRKKENIQIMRGLAILLVVFQHALIAVFGTGGENSTYHFDLFQR